MTERTKIPAAFGKAVAVLALMLAGAANAANAGEYLSPTALTASPDGKFLYVACATTDRVIAFDVGAGKVAQQWRIGASPSGVAVSTSITHPAGARQLPGHLDEWAIAAQPRY